MSQSLGKEIRKGFIWNFSEQASFKLMQFVIQIVLTRLLMPEDYGLVALSLAFVNFATVFVNAGFGSALIYKKDATTEDFSSVCWTNIGIACFLYIILFFTAPIIADFYNDERITLIIRIMTVSLILGAYNSVQIAIVQKNMQFKKSFLANVTSVSTSAILGIWAAFSGYGVWSLVIQYITNRIIATLSFYLLNRWLPKFTYSWNAVKSLFSYGWKLMVSSMLSTLSADIYSLVIGKYFSKAQLGIFDTGNKIPNNLGNTVATTVGTVLFSAFSKVQNNPDQIRSYLKKANQTSAILVFPMLLFVAAMAKPLVIYIFTEKWIEAVPYLQVACVMYSFYPIHLANLQVAKAVGRTDLSLWVELAKKIVDIAFLLLTVKLGLIWVAIGLTLSSLVALWINIEPIKKYINYSTIQQLKDVMPALLSSLVTAAIIYCVPIFINISTILIIIIQCLIGFSLYIAISFIFNREIMKSLIYQVKSIMTK